MYTKKMVFLSTLALHRPKGWWICQVNGKMSKRRVRREWGRMKQIRNSNDHFLRMHYD
jgi:hypothetical protein